ncbi:50S ribosomal protein L24 [Fulvivirgaceae bacterium BMA10]|uniref:Large ribosomal subunit protein uL24 n=1 Tax=Splendidivirga corallicola TaxID=3051826 RepID=A0ABT8KWI8_9BACT|nr:50S ribosomal protein L24 [Fulvivirgaceae bacterium BMA10]
MKKVEKKQNKLHIKKGDTVKIIAGNSRGKTGKVLEILKQKDRAIVEGANIVVKHVKPSANNPEGGIEKTEAGIHISNLMVVDPKSGEPTRVGRKLDDNGKLQRYSKKTQEII